MSSKSFITLLLLVIGSTLLAQDKESFRKNFKVDPIKLFSNTLMMEFEKLNKKGTKSNSLGIGVTYTENQDYSYSYNNEEKMRIGVRLEYIGRIYFKKIDRQLTKKNKEVTVGLYGGMFINGGYEEQTFEFTNYNNDSNSSEENIRTGKWIFPGFMIGVNRTFWDKLVIDAYVGGGLRVLSTLNSNPAYEDNYYYSSFSPLDYGGVAPNIGLKIGFWLD